MKEEALQYIYAKFNQKNVVDSPVRCGYLQSVLHFMVYACVRYISEINQVIQFCKNFGFSEGDVQTVIHQLIQDQYLKIENNKIEITDLKITIKNHEKVVGIGKEFAGLISEFILERGGMSVPDRVSHSLMLGLNEKSYELAVEAHKYFIHQLWRLESQSEQVDRFVLFSNTWFSEPFTRVEASDVPTSTGNNQQAFHAKNSANECRN